MCGNLLVLDGIWTHTKYKVDIFSIPDSPLPVWTMLEGGEETPGIITGGVRVSWPPLGPLHPDICQPLVPNTRERPRHALEEIRLTTHQEREERIQSGLMAGWRGY